jgi:hypothetical protein
MWQSQERNHERCHRLQSRLQRCELRLEVRSRSGCFRTAHLHHLRHCLCSAEILIFCSIRSFRKSLLKGHSLLGAFSVHCIYLCALHWPFWGFPRSLGWAGLGAGDAASVVDVEVS